MGHFSTRAMWTRTGLAGGLVVALALGLGAPPAAAKPSKPSKPGALPATAPEFPLAATATRYTGKGFDTCTAPSKATMKAWKKASPYEAVGVYLSGTNRACRQPNLTASWVADVSAMGWRLLPISMGLQAPCRDNRRKKPMSAKTSGPQGAADAKAAVAAATALGLAPGSPVYADIESYDKRNASCVKTVATYISAFTLELHRAGYLAGVYGNLGSGMADLSDRYSSPTHARPDAVWLARWDSTTRLTGWTGIPDTQWPLHQRSKQYRGDHDEKYGGVRLNIDSDYVDGPVATVARPVVVPAGANVRTRQAPGLDAPITGKRPPGDTVRVLCRAVGGQVVGTTTSNVWDKLDDGSYMADAYLGAPVLPACRYPAQVATVAGANVRSGPGPGFPTAGGALPAGALAWVTCQIAGPAGTGVWNRLEDGAYVDNSLIAGTTAGFNPAVPRC
jgi:hypothetical protein